MTTEKRKVTACIVDDDQIFVYGFKKILQIKGIFAEIHDFGDGQQAMSYLINPSNTANLPDIIFVDINMPVMDGWEFIRNFEEIKSQMGKNITVYAISSSVDMDDIVRARNIPAVKDYILKPIDDLFLTRIFQSCDDLLNLALVN